MPLLAETALSAQALARFARTGKYEAIPGVSPERAAVYRELIFNGVEDSLRRAYPIAQAYLAKKPGVTKLFPSLWTELVTEFLTTTPLSSPQLWQMPKQFYQFVAQGNYSTKLGLLFLEDLLHFEWTEIEIYMMEDKIVPEYLLEGDILSDNLVVNPEHQVLHLQFPVFKNKPIELEGTYPGHYFLVSYRHPKTLNACFVELSPLFTLLFEKLSREELSGQEALEQGLEYLSLAVPQQGVMSQPKVDRKSYQQQGLAFLTMLKQQGLILGFRQRRKED